jgi:hypothetical protein
VMTTVWPDAGNRVSRLGKSVGTTPCSVQIELPRAPRKRFPGIESQGNGPSGPNAAGVSEVEGPRFDAY